MAATINISINGIAMCYQKKVNGKNVWRVLCPFDDCHSIKLSSDRAGTKEFLGHFGRANSTLKILTESATSQAGSTADFDSHVFDLTSADTHSQIRVKKDWKKKGVLLTIENVVFEIETFLDESTAAKRFDLVLTDAGGTTKKILTRLAHSIKGTIKLGDKGRVIVKSGSNKIFASNPDETCSLLFDNDCARGSDITNNKNDMEMFYELIEDPQQAGRKFLVEGTPKKGVRALPKPMTGFGFFAGDKPCLVVKASSTTNLP